MATTSVMGGAVRRREDPALIQGRGVYVDDLAPVGLLHVAFTRSPMAHAKITSIDTSEALEVKGVVAVYTHDDVAHLGPLVAQVPVGTLRPLLADGKVKHVGEAVAMVIAEDRYQAQDAADAVMVDYDELSAWAESDARQIGRGKRILRGEEGRAYVRALLEQATEDDPEGRALLRKVQAESAPGDAAS